MTMTSTRADTVAATVDFRGESYFTRLEASSMDRFTQFALVAADEATKDAGLSPEDLSSPRVAVYFGTGIGGAYAVESSYRSFLDPNDSRVSPMTIVLTMANAGPAMSSPGPAALAGAARPQGRR